MARLPEAMRSRRSMPSPAARGSSPTFAADPGDSPGGTVVRSRAPAAFTSSDPPRRPGACPALLLLALSLGACGPSSPGGKGEPVIGLSASSLHFSATAGASDPPAQTVLVSDLGSGTLAEPTTSITYDGGSGWLTAGVSGAAAPYTVTVGTSIAGLAPGTYGATVSVDSVGASNAPQALSVELTVHAAPPAIQLAPTGLAFSATQGELNPLWQTVTVSNSGGGTLAPPDVTISYGSGSGWLSATSSGSAAPYPITVQPMVGGLAPGTYGATVSVACEGASNSPQSIAVAFTVQSAGTSSLLVTTSSAILEYDASSGSFTQALVSGGTSFFSTVLGPDGDLYVADFSAKTVSRYNAQTGAALGVFAQPACSPYQVAFGPDLNLYVGCNGGAITRFDGTTGASMGTFIEPPAASADFGGMAFFDGSLFVTYIDTAGSLYQYDASTGSLIAPLYSAFASNGPRTPVFGPDGSLYVPIWQTRYVDHFAAGTYDYLGHFILDISLDPLSLAFAPDGSVLVMNDPGSNDTVRRYDGSTGAFLSTLVSAGSGGLARGGAILLLSSH